jgi:hypothetical protein
MKKKTGTFPVKLKVTHQRVRHLYQTIFDLSKEDYEKLTAPRISSNLQDTRDKLKLLQRNGEYYIGEMPNFSFYEFERDFITNNDLFKKRKNLKEPPPNLDQDDFDYSPYLRRFPIFKEDHSTPGSISIVYLAYIKILLQEERIGTALSYKDSYNSIKIFKGNVLFTDITTSYLH